MLLGSGMEAFGAPTVEGPLSGRSCDPASAWEFLMAQWPVH